MTLHEHMKWTYTYVTGMLLSLKMMLKNVRGT